MDKLSPWIICLGLLVAECFNKFISPTCLTNILKTGTVAVKAKANRPGATGLSISFSQ